MRLDSAFLLVAFTGLSVMAQDSGSSRPVALIWGSIDLPRDYKAIACPRCDSCRGGSFESQSDKARIYWSQSETPWWLPSDEDLGFRVIWRTPSVRRWHLYWEALVDIRGERQYQVTTQGLWLWADESTPNARERLSALVDAYAPDRESATYEAPQCIPE